jgi:hypothetical protein
MKVYEILSLNREFLEKLQEFGIKLSDSEHVDVYNEYMQMKRSGDKMAYIVAFLSDKYKICERKVYKIIKTMEKDCQIDAV